MRWWDEHPAEGRGSLNKIKRIGFLKFVLNSLLHSNAPAKARQTSKKIGRKHDDMPSVERGEQVGGDGRWRVLRVLGEGQFAEVFEVEDVRGGHPHAHYALKLERSPHTNSVLGEYKVLRRLRDLAYVPKVMEVGEHRGRYFLVMDLLGRNLHSVRAGFPKGRLEVGRVREIGLATLEVLRSVHQAGYVHRDVKPANFVHGHREMDAWFLVDFGLARRYLDERGGMIAERMGAGFRGSSTYASFNAQQEKDQGRRDDLWSWLYSLVELLTGTLPWRMLKDSCPRKDLASRMLGMKLMCKGSPQELTAPMPMPWGMVKICEHLRTLEFTDDPDYGLIRQALESLDDGLAVRGEEHTLMRGRIFPESRSQGTGSDGHTRVSNSPTECSDRNERCVIGGGPCMDHDNEMEGACMLSRAKPTPSSLRTPPAMHQSECHDTPEAIRLRSGNYCGSSQSMRMGGWDGRVQGGACKSYPRHQGDDRYEAWPHQDNFPDHHRWNGNPYCRQECFGRNGSWQDLQWQGGGGVCWNNSGASMQGKYSHPPYQNSHYQGYNCRPMSPVWNQEHPNYREFGKPYVHAHPPCEQIGGAWQEWENCPRQVLSHSGSPDPFAGRGCDRRIQGRPISDMAGPVKHEVVKVQVDACVIKHAGDGGDAPGLVEGAPTRPPGMRDMPPTVGVTPPHPGFADFTIRRSPGRGLVRGNPASHAGDDDPGALPNKRKRLGGEGDRDGKSIESGIKFMQDCVNWVQSDEGPSRAASLLEEFAAMDPLEGVSYVAAICTMLGSGSPDSLVRSVLSDISVYARYLSQKSDKQCENGSK